MNKKKAMSVSILVFLLCIICGITSQAATNPLKTLSSKINWIISGKNGMGCDYFTPQYKKNFKMTVTSSNEKVATVRVYPFKNVLTGAYSKGFEITVKKPGKTKIKVTVEMGGKKYSKVVKCTYYKYSNPFSIFKINGKSYKSKFNKLSGDGAIYWKVPSGKLQYKLKSGYKITGMQGMFRGTSASPIELKNGTQIPKRKGLVIVIQYQNTKTKANGTIWIEP